MVIQHVRGAQQGAHNGVVHLFAARAQLVHQGLEHVGEPDQIIQTKRPCSALYRVNGAETGIDGLDV